MNCAKKQDLIRRDKQISNNSKSEKGMVGHKDMLLKIKTSEKKDMGLGEIVGFGKMSNMGLGNLHVQLTSKCTEGQMRTWTLRSYSRDMGPLR